MKKMLILLSLYYGGIDAQELNKHRWKDRLLLIYTSEWNTAEVRQQLQHLKNAEEDLKDRRVKVYVISEERFCFDFSSDSEPNKKRVPIGKPFEIVLIGLDGGEKFRSEEVQPAQTFNDLIDQMPMRRQELKGKNKN